MAMQLSTGSTKGKRPQPVPVINVTPLVDIALVVLIIFMIIVPMSQRTFWLNFPKQEKPEKPKASEPEDEEGPLVMTIDSQGVIRVNQAVLRKSDIPVRLPRMLAAQPLPILYFDAADSISYGKAVEVMDIAKLSGAKAVAVLTEKVAK
jgi:biopolymer transport protein ExbD